MSSLQKPFLQQPYCHQDKVQKYLFYIVCFFLVVSSSLLAHTATSFESISEKGDKVFYVTTSDFCNFLNAVAAEDPLGFYGEVKENVSVFPVIDRKSGAQGYSYRALEGQEASHITGLSLATKARYCNWLENGSPQAEEGSYVTEEGSYRLQGSELLEISDQATYYVIEENRDHSVEENPFMISINTSLAEPQIQMNSELVEAGQEGPLIEALFRPVSRKAPVRRKGY